MSSLKCFHCGRRWGQSENSFLFIEWGERVKLQVCPECRKPICQVCMKRYGECPHCAFLRREQRAKEISAILQDMRVYSKNYAGRIPLDMAVPQQEFKLWDWYDTREEALDALKYNVASSDLNLIYELQYLRDTEEDETEGGGTYYHTVWSCKCMAGRYKEKKKQ